MANDTPQQDDTGETRSLSQALRRALSDALGLPAETFLVEILLGESTPVVRCHFYPGAEALQRAVVLFGEYQLVAKPREVAEDAGPMLPVTSSLPLPDAQSER